MSVKRLPILVATALLLALALGPLALTASQATTPPGGPPAAGLPQAPAPPAAQRQPVYGQLPLLFVENRGQTDPQVAFTLLGSTADIFFTSTGVTYALSEPSPSETASALADRFVASQAAPPSDAAPPQRWVVKLDFVGANPGVQPVGRDPAETVVSYFRGRPEEWHTGLRTFQRVVYPDLWPGIDLAYYGVDGAGAASALKYEFIVHPGADSDQIRLAYRGAERVVLNDAGQIDVTTPIGGFADDLPVAWQEGAGVRTPVQVAYDFTAGGPAASGERQASGFGFRLGPYDPTRTLVLDPVVLWYCGYIGGALEDYASGIAADGAGNVYVAGHATSTQTSFPETVGPDLTYNGGGSDAFVAKINPTGTGLVYAGYIGGSGSDSANGIAVDRAGSAYVTGYTESNAATFPETGGPDLTYNGSYDAFVAKINPAGTALTYAGYIGGSAYDSGNGIAVDSAGNAYVTGSTTSTQASFPEVGGPDLTYNGDESDAFVAKVSATGAALIYAGYIGGDRKDYGNGIAVDNAGNTYVAGWTQSSQATFPVTVGPDLTMNGSPDAFVAKVDAAGTIAYAGYIGGSIWDYGNGIALDAAGNAYVVGDTGSSQATFPVAGGPDLTQNGDTDAFVAKVNANGTALSYAGYIGGLQKIAAEALRSTARATHMSRAGPSPMKPPSRIPAGPTSHTMATQMPLSRGLVQAGPCCSTAATSAAPALMRAPR